MYSTFKATFLDHYKEEEQADEMIRRVMAARLDANDLVCSLCTMDCQLEKTGFNAPDKFGLLLAAAMEHLDLAQLAIYSGGYCLCWFAKGYHSLLVRKSSLSIFCCLRRLFCLWLEL